MKRLARVSLTLRRRRRRLAGGYELWDYYMLSPWTRDARVQADVVNIAPDVAGFVDDLRVKDNQFVHKGDVMLVIDRARYRRLWRSREAKVAAARRRWKTPSSRQPAGGLTTSRSPTRRARTASPPPTRRPPPTSRRWRIAVDGPARPRPHRIRAPVNGNVTNLTLVVGQYASVGTKIMALIDSDSYRVPAISRKPRSRHAPRKAGQNLPDERRPPLHGHVESVSRGITDRTTPTVPNCWPMSSRPSSGCGWRSGFRYASTSMMSPRGC